VRSCICCHVYLTLCCYYQRRGIDKETPRRKILFQRHIWQYWERLETTIDISVPDVNEISLSFQKTFGDGVKVKGRLFLREGSTRDLPILCIGHFDIVHALDIRMKCTSKRAADALVSHALTHCRLRFPIILATTPFSLKFLACATKTINTLQT
jgi:hypothetical protein